VFSMPRAARSSERTLNGDFVTTRPSPTPKRSAGDTGKRGVALLAALLTALPAPQVLGQAPAAAPVPAAASVSGATPAPAQADDPGALVARIALYPDDLVAIILPASTNPLQIVQAERFLAKRKTDPKTPIDEKWDDAVKSLVNYPEVITMMSGDLDWTAALGEAVVADQAGVLEAIQAFRRKTQAAGNLKSDEKQTVVVEKEVITIAPTNPEVIYVPQYNPTTVVVSGGYAGYGYYPSPYPVYYYPYAPGAAFATGLIWGAAMGAIWSGGRYGANYGGGDININRNTNINTGDINTGNRGSGNRTSQTGAGGEKWSSGKQKGQVSKSVGANPPSSRVGDARGGAGASAGTMDRGGGGGARGGTGASAGTMERGGGGGGGGGSGPSAGTMDRGGGGGGAAFDGYGSGRSTQMDSSRGASSRGASPSASSRGASPSAASRGGGGGGGRGGGGGGRRR
jgi:hypothetical protein